MTGWTARGELPASLPEDPNDFSADVVDGLTEDIWQAECGAYCIDLGWYPDCDPKGHFCVRLVKDHNWLKPVKEVRTKSYAVARAFIDDEMALASGCGFY